MVNIFLPEALAILMTKLLRVYALRAISGSILNSARSDNCDSADVLTLALGKKKRMTCRKRVHVKNKRVTGSFRVKLGHGFA